MLESGTFLQELRYTTMKRNSPLALLIQRLTSCYPTTVESPLLNGLSDKHIPRPFKQLPNVATVKVVVNMYDPLLLRSGLARRLPPNIEAQPLAFKIKAANRYLRIMQNRLANLLLRGDLLGFWIFSLMLLGRSKVLRIVALRQIHPQWQRDLSFAHVVGLLHVLHAKILNLDARLHVRRRYADKVLPDGSVTFRPIGDPVYIDRMFLHLLQGFFVMCCAHYIGPNQHAYLPGRGVTSAWADVKALLSMPYIYEYDLKGAFPSLDIRFVWDTLISLGIPKEIADFVCGQALGTIEMPNPLGDEIPEVKREAQVRYEMPAEQKELLYWMAFDQPTLPEGEPDIIGADGLPPRWAWEAIAFEMPHAFEGIPDIPSLLQPGDIPSTPPQEFADPNSENWTAHTAMSEMDVPGSNWNVPGVLEREVTTVHGHESSLTRPTVHTERVLFNPHPITMKGFPQGSGLSPIIWNLVFATAVERSAFALPGVTIKAYADDFLVFAKSKLLEMFPRTETFVAAGLAYAEAKSRLLKAGGEWKASKFKFLGNTLVTGKELISFPASNDLGPTEIAKLAIVGTPRSGAVNLPMTDLTHHRLQAREAGLWSILRSKITKDSFGHYRHPAGLLAAWGRNEFPASLIPLDLIQGAKRSTRAFLTGLSEAVATLSSSDSEGSESEGTVSPGLAARLSQLFRAGKIDTFNWLRTRYAGLQQSMLHSPAETEDVEYSHNKIYAPRSEGKLRKGPNMVTLIGPHLNPYHFPLSVFNASSYGTFALLQSSRGVIPRGRRGLRLRQALPPLVGSRSRAANAD